MANVVKSQLKLGFVVGTSEGKDVVKSKTMASILPDLTDALMSEFATLVIAVSAYQAKAQRVDTKDLD